MAHSESKANEHAAGIGLYRPVDKCAYVGEISNRIETVAYLFLAQTQYCAVEIDVFAAGECWVEAGAKFQKGKPNLPEPTPTA